MKTSSEVPCRLSVQASATAQHDLSTARMGRTERGWHALRLVRSPDGRDRDKHVILTKRTSANTGTYGVRLCAVLEIGIRTSWTVAARTRSSAKASEP